MLRLKDYLAESGIRNIKAIAKEWKKAAIYFHIDMDGVASGLAMKKYLEDNKIKVVEAIPIQYGDQEYLVKKVGPDVMNVLVDFAHGKPMMTIHTDHHESQIGVRKGTSTSFKKARSNASTIGNTISPSPIFSAADIDIINIIDSANYANNDIVPDDVINALFKIDKFADIQKNHRAMGFVANKLLLAYKNRPNFMSQLVMKAQPSMFSILTTILRIAKVDGLKSIDKIIQGYESYTKTQKANFIADTKTAKNKGTPIRIKELKDGHYTIINNSLMVQYGGGNMFKGYDRYTAFKNHPEIDYFCMGWSMGLVQLSKNPFKKNVPDLHMGNIAMGVMKDKFKSSLQKTMVNLEFIKFTFERSWGKSNMRSDVIGFTGADLMALFGKSLKGKPNLDEVMNTINILHKDLTWQQKALLKSIEIPAWDIIEAQSGGHKDITNISGLNFIGFDVDKLIKNIMFEIAKVFYAKMK